MVIHTFLIVFKSLAFSTTTIFALQSFKMYSHISAVHTPTDSPLIIVNTLVANFVTITTSYPANTAPILDANHSTELNPRIPTAWLGFNSSYKYQYKQY